MSPGTSETPSPPTGDSREYPRDFPIFVHSLNADSTVKIDEYPINRFSEISLPPPTAELKLRWLHAPANSMQWVEECIRKWYPGSMGLSDECWTLKLRPALSQITETPIHSRHMEPSCSTRGDLSHRSSRVPGSAQEMMGFLSMPFVAEAEMKAEEEEAAAPPRAGDHQAMKEDFGQPVLVTYMPYMNWDLYGNYCRLSSTYKQARGFESSCHAELDDDERSKMELALARGNMDGDRPLHPRRTLDQFYYSSLRNTTTRDSDQTISKWTGSNLQGDGRQRAAEDSRLIMVDQLWCWVLDNKTILTFFPSHGLQYQGSTTKRFTDLYTSILQNCTSCDTVWDLYSLLIKEASSYLFRQDNRQFTDLIETYRWVINTKAALQTTYLEEYSNDHQSNRDLGSSTALNDRRELQLVLEVADIIDELKMINHLADKQREVLKSLVLALRKLSPEGDSSDSPGGALNFVISNNAVRDTGRQQNIIYMQQSEGISGQAQNIKILAQRIRDAAAREAVVSADETLMLLMTEVEIMRKDADYTQKMLLNLLDLKQKAAALAEARSTSQQGRVIMLFTIVTIIFLPLSFFTSYFGQNASDITGDDNNHTSDELWRIGAPISVVVILFALFIAYLITRVGTWKFGCFGRASKSKSKSQV